MQTEKNRLLCNHMCIVEVAQELGLDIKVVKAIVDSQSEYTKVVMESNSFDSVRWPYFGVFRSKPKEIQMLSYLRGMTPEQQKDFKKAVRTKQIILAPWELEKRNKKKNDKRQQHNTGPESIN